MKRKMLILPTLLLAGVGFTSCDKEVDSTALVVNLSRTITVKGYVYAELNNRSAGLEYAPAGTKIFFSIPYSDLNPTAVTGKWSDTTTVDDNGQFTIQIPVDDNGVNLTIEAQPFEYNQIQPFGSNSNSIKKFYSAAPVVKAFSTTQKNVVEVFYTATTPANFVEKVKLNVTVEAELNNSIAGNELVANQKITLHNSDWAQEYTTDENGEFTAVVPANQNIYYTISFEYAKTVPDGLGFKQENYKYEIKSGYVGNFGSESDITIDLGGGVPAP
ncbi:MAG: hypothetical protein N2662_03405 [Bacteroidales bacterium]|nr:hypothetical protein [Bacteroidales bacterium]